ncbi:helix-turn-helix domain-containing protein [Halobaculum litoreum]|uniref:Helix-turn-helix domain-containing protein n=1 Tax=Halobaculum litoreum TaxID=3031998 RepID=A0ABD5XPR2_9EURY|nr:helix-turn-helix domain-containing protein [Halobaculum sp. DT92]
MSVLARISIDEDDFELGRALTGLPEAVVELERVIPTAEAAVPYFWVHSATAEEVAEAVAGTEYVEEVSLVDEVDDTLLYRCTFRLIEGGVVTGFIESGLTLLSGTGRGGRWTFDVRSEKHGALGEFQRFCAERDIRLRLESLTEDVLPGAETTLTDAQREALSAAFAAGYYDSPRTATLEDVAGLLDISRQSLAERLRRGTRNLLEHELGAEAAEFG